MSSIDDIISEIEDFENMKTKTMSKEAERFYADLKTGVDALGEISLKKELEGYYGDFVKKQSRKTNWKWGLGIAATFLVLLGTWWEISPKRPIKEWKMDQAPIYSDSADYSDTLKHAVDSVDIIQE